MGAPPPAELDPERIGEADVGGFLAQVKIHHPGVRQLERFEGGFLAGGDRRLDLGGADLQSKPADFDAVEAQRQFGQRRIAPLADVFDDVGDREVDVGRQLTLGGEQRLKAPLEIRRLHIERHGHRKQKFSTLGFCRGASPRPSSRPRT